MPWAAEINKSISIEDWGPAGTAYSNCYAKATLTISTTGETLNYTIKMATQVTGTTEKPAVALYLNIYDNVILNKYWVYNTTSDGWKDFPTKNGSTYSGTVNIGSSSKVPVIFKIRTAQNAVSSGVWDDSYSGNFTRTWYTEVGTGSVDITDNLDNSFTVSVTSGSNGSNNPVTKRVIWWAQTRRADNSWSYTAANNSELFTGASASKTIALSITNAANATKNVVGAVETFGSFGDYTDSGWLPNGTSSTGSTYANGKAIKQYVAPTSPSSIPKISIKKSRVTLKENWTYKWGAASKTNNSSPVAGYRIRIYKTTKDSNNQEVTAAIKGLKCSTSNNMVTKESGTNDYVDRDGTSCEISFNPINLGFTAGDKVSVEIFAYAKNGKGETYWKRNGNEVSLYSTTPSTSVKSLVENAGIVRVKADGVWHEGQVWVKADGKWYEADIVKTKVDGSWVESQ